MEWLASSCAGAKLAKLEQGLLNNLLPHCFGNHLLCLGPACTRLDLSLLSIQHRIYLNQPVEGRLHHAIGSRATVVGATGVSTTGISADELNLPFFDQSIDAVILYHGLEFSEQPEQLLHELWRVLRPGGYLLGCGLNPLSLLGAWHWAEGWRGSEVLPWQAQLHSLHWLKQQLCSLGAEFKLIQSCFFRPPLKHSQNLQQLRFLEALGPLLWPLSGASYWVLAVKRAIPLTPVGFNWRQQFQLKPVSAIKPATRSANQ